MSTKKKNNFRSGKKSKEPGVNPDKKSGTLFAVVLLFIITYFCFSSTIKNELTNWDDQNYIVENPLVKSLSFDNIKEIFSTDVMGNYHPLSILSLAVDYNIYQLKPAGYHATNLIIHLLNVLLVYIFFRMLSRNVIIAFITALFFGIHPMHVESVAWVSERKDVLYVFFFIAALCSYLLYIRSQKQKWVFYSITLILFILSVLSKGQAVTLTVVLLLIDFLLQRKFEKKIFFEKIPFFLISLFGGIIAIIAQKKSGAIIDIPLFPLFDRILFASYGFLSYILKAILPINLSAYYTYPLKINDTYPFVYFVAPVVVLFLFIIIYKKLIKQKELIFGFTFFVVNLILLLQLLPVGGSLMSERYSYLSYIGLFFIAGDSFSKVWYSTKSKISSYKYLFAALLILFTIFFGYSTQKRIKIWKNSETLWSDVIKKNSAAVIAFGNRGSYYQKQGQLELALQDFNAALKLKPDHVESLINRSDVYRVNAQYNLSIADCDKAISINNKYSGAYMNRGIAYCIVGRFDEAFIDFKKVISIDPKNANVYCNRGNLFDMKNQLDSALLDYSTAISLKPDYAEAFYNRGKSFLKKQDYSSAINDFNSTLHYSSNYNDVYYFRSLAYKGLGDFRNALQDALTTKQLAKPIDENYILDLQNKVKQ